MIYHARIKSTFQQNRNPHSDRCARILKKLQNLIENEHKIEVVLIDKTITHSLSNIYIKTIIFYHNFLLFSKLNMQLIHYLISIHCEPKCVSWSSRGHAMKSRQPKISK